MRANERMLRALARVPARAVLRVARRFAPVLDAGLVDEGGCTYLAYCRARVAWPAGLDETGRECWVNSLHVEDWYRTHVLLAALAFSDAVLALWEKRQGRPEGLVCLISQSRVAASRRQAVVWKMHRQRPGHDWLAPDLSGYDDAVLELASRDDIALVKARLCQRA
ncbi:hypothetical protein HNW77_11430 [Komagataeibacter sp. AV436]|uniref:Uncharacterized protein n=1 Tax=Komagataeibacter melomenusus TaxID=2766578 RepID=A0ABX2AFA0_9PROT|nr:hypothetical protein [Komagataeibacter melomenusus]MBV1831495.1 hypothetical protein [Komagataeibacter melomenusus]NPC66993.1 hypothetical protein [Komagataeibacter melomenusus]